ncbi:DEAD/DEAH box helicase [Fusobacterium sp.]|uniref:DEAD/DEAH box helicase n=1 Tax=Fusobacterium sp. TaxID=68766 RepID=UPI0025C08CC4|nr:DEAD/DEAH box helicase [Fusobacterium sp.]MCI5725282.1 DEAD/DEAH box helicase [Fusobacterium sp.]
MKYIKDLKKLVSAKTFVKGVDYYNDSSVRVKDILTLENEINIKSSVKGSMGKRYRTEITINRENGGLKNVDCNCPAFGSYEIGCKHIVALALEVEEAIDILLGNKDFNDLSVCDRVRYLEYFTKKEKAQKNISSIDIEVEREKYIEKNFHTQIKMLENIISNQNLKKIEIETNEKKKLYLEIVIDFENQWSRDLSKILRLKVGDIKKSYVNNIENFCQMVLFNGEYVISKNIIYNPKEYFFSDIDLNMIKNIYEYIIFMKQVGIENSKILSTKGLFLNAKLLEIVLDNIDEKNKLLYIDREYRRVKKYEPIFIIKNNKIGYRTIQRLESDSLFYFFESNDTLIYKMSKEENEILNSLSYINKKFIENLADDLQERLKTIFKNKQITLAELSNKVGRIIVFAEQMDKNSVYLKIFPEDESYIIDGKYYIFKHNIEVLENIGTFFKVDKKRLKLEPIIVGKLSDEKFLEFSEYLAENVAEEDVILKIDEKIKKVKPLNFSIDIEKGSNNLLDFKFSMEGINLEDTDFILEEIKKSKKYIRLTTGELLRVMNKNFEELISIINNISNLKIGTNKISKLKALQLSQLSTQIENKLSELDEFKKVFKSLKQKKDEDPKDIKIDLFPYQKNGFNWLKKLYDLELGGILADDMGLGKTIQAISLLATINYEKKAKLDESIKAIVIVPTSLLYNWKEEFFKFSYIQPIIVDGAKKDREKTIKNFKEGILITTYQTLKNDIGNYKDIFFDVAILDEAQNIKNIITKVKKTVMQIKSKVNFALTGTPIENNIIELWSIFDFILTGYLDNIADFKKTSKEILKEEDSKKLMDLRKIISPFILRRSKKEVLTELPDKIETNIFISLSDEQKKLYANYVQRAKIEIASLNKEENNRIKILAILTKLRQICNSPNLFDETYKGEAAKIEVLKEMLPDIIENNHRFLIFSQFVGTLKEIEILLKEQNIDYFYIDGSVKSKERMEISKKFNSGEKTAVLISLKAGGTGLNLIGADVVVHYDPWWNIAVEDQASNRAHRIGQKNSVQIIKLITKGTIEEKILKIQEQKRLLSETLIEKKVGEKTLFELSDSELLDLINKN